MEIIDVDQDVFMGDFILDFDAFIRHGGNIADGEEDSKRIDELLLRARKTYGIHFQGDEAELLTDSSGEFYGSSMPVNIQGTFSV